MFWYERARVLTRLNKNNEAISCYKECLEIAPNFNDAFKKYGNFIIKELIH